MGGRGERGGGYYFSIICSAPDVPQIIDPTLFIAHMTAGIFGHRYCGEVLVHGEIYKSNETLVSAYKVGSG